MPDRAITGSPDCPLGEFFVLGPQLLQADDVGLGFGEPAHQHREAAINAVHVEGRDFHLFPMPFSATSKIAGPSGKLQMNQAYAGTKLASRRAYETLELNTTRNALREEENNALQEEANMADDDALFQKGMPIRREVLGPEYVDASMARPDE